MSLELMPGVPLRRMEWLDFRTYQVPGVATSRSLFTGPCILLTFMSVSVGVASSIRIYDGADASGAAIWISGNTVLPSRELFLRCDTGVYVVTAGAPAMGWTFVIAPRPVTSS